SEADVGGVECAVSVTAEDVTAPGVQPAVAEVEVVDVEHEAEGVGRGEVTSQLHGGFVRGRQFADEVVVDDQGGTFDVHGQAEETTGVGVAQASLFAQVGEVGAGGVGAHVEEH